MFVFNNLTSRATSIAIIILGVAIGYSVYTHGNSPSKLSIAAQNNYDAGQNNPEPVDDLSSFLPTTTPTFIPDSLTGLIGQSVFSTFTDAQKSGTAIGNDTVDTMSGAFAQGIEENSLVDFSEITENDLSIISNPSQSDWQNFSSKVLNIMNTYRNKFLTLSQIKNADSDLGAAFGTIAKAGSLYTSLSNDLKAVRVPVDAQEDYINLLNSYALSGASLSEAKYYSSDPVRAVVAFNLHGQASQLEVIALYKLQKLFQQNGIIFTFKPLSS